MSPEKQKNCPVTQENCDKRHRVWIFNLTIAVSIIIALPVWSVSAGYHAENIAKQVDTLLQVHESKQETREEFITKTLIRIETIQEKILDKIDKAH